ncbi:multicopper oxidase family protein [Roseicella aquatilis]|uniref:Spore coat protein A n=1 Tax=Roseicella aquatilis TaxID=2527868 RepID=A0A4R4D3A2_9PROT|nr:multicopper oxidase domain-containing protein [Roseicella aquatilis]TCZ50779.1 spore coat protein A [Roseicella aquatilis]
MSVDPRRTADSPTPTLLDPETQDRFVHDLPIPPVIDARRGGFLTIEMREFQHWAGLEAPDGTPLLTTVWGYGLRGQEATWPGPTILARENVPVAIRFENELPRDGHLLPVDRSFDVGTLPEAAWEAGYIPTAVHLHGGNNPSRSDGLPDAWFTQDWRFRGEDFALPVNFYPNQQDAATLFYHDHAIGLSRLNVYAGLAAFYEIQDRQEQALVRRGVLPGEAYDLGLAIQDRAFTTEGHLYRPAFADDPIPGLPGDTVRAELGEGYDGPFPSILPEFFGDVVTVNGMAWPKLEVDPGDVRLRLLNGSDSRAYVLELSDPRARLTLVGNEQGLLPHAIDIADGDGVQEPGERIVLAPGERLDVVLDLSHPGLRGQAVTLLNSGPAFDPFKGFVSPDGALAGEVEAATAEDPVGNVMQFHVGTADLLPNTASVVGGAVLDREYQELCADSADRTRKLGLFEQEDEFGRVMPMLGVAETTTDETGATVRFGPLGYRDPTTEVVRLGDREVWQIFNFTEDAHPIHLHLVRFQLLGRFDYEGFDRVDNATGAPGGDGETDAVELGERRAARPEDAGWQDTIWVAPGEAVSIIASFDRPGEYVWHCHILSHEDNEMMRPFVVQGGPSRAGQVEAGIEAALATAAGAVAQAGDSLRAALAGLDLGPWGG